LQAALPVSNVEKVLVSGLFGGRRDRFFNSSGAIGGGVSSSFAGGFDSFTSSLGGVASGFNGRFSGFLGGFGGSSSFFLRAGGESESGNRSGCGKSEFHGHMGSPPTERFTTGHLFVFRQARIDHPRPESASN